MRYGKSVGVPTGLWEGKTARGSGTNDGLIDAYGVRDSESIGLRELGIFQWMSALTAQLALYLPIFSRRHQRNVKKWQSDGWSVKFALDQTEWRRFLFSFTHEGSSVSL